MGDDRVVVMSASSACRGEKFNQRSDRNGFHRVRAARRRDSSTVQKPCSRPSMRITGTRSPYSARSRGSASTSLACHATSSSAQIRATSARATAQAWHWARTSNVTSCFIGASLPPPPGASPAAVWGQTAANRPGLVRSVRGTRLATSRPTVRSLGGAPRSVSPSYASARLEATTFRRPLTRTVGTSELRSGSCRNRDGPRNPRTDPQPRAGVRRVPDPSCAGYADA
jgi:hypothetical protein